jgi:CDP-diacylglycerol---glycerol-3-phosphate 3-phosphatidyltransferase
MNLPNRLTCIRVGLAFIFFGFDLVSKTTAGRAIALFLFLAAVLTDYFDGKIARERGEITDFGKLMDPIADKLLTSFAFLGFFIAGFIPLWMVAIVLLRDITLTAFRLRMPSRGTSKEARASGKFKTAIQFVFIVGVLIYETLLVTVSIHPHVQLAIKQWIYYGMIVIVILTAWSAVEFAMKSRKIV